MNEKRYTVEKVWPHLSNCCVVIMNHSGGSRCGYVGVKPDHVLFKKDYSDPLLPTLVSAWEKVKDGPIGKRGILDLFRTDPENPRTGILFDVHGGVTYSGGDEKNYPIEMKDIWWFGFDCAHSGDGHDIDQIFPESSRQYYKNYEGDIVRSLDYCISECESLSQQLEDLR